MKTKNKKPMTSNSEKPRFTKPDYTTEGRDERIEFVKKEIKKILPKCKIKLIGSLAVPMKGKKEMDILIQTNNVEQAQNILKEKGYKKGPIANQEGFCRNYNYQVIIELHIIPFKHKKRI